MEKWVDGSSVCGAWWCAHAGNWGSLAVSWAESNHIGQRTADKGEACLTLVWCSPLRGDFSGVPGFPLILSRRKGSAALLRIMMQMTASQPKGHPVPHCIMLDWTSLYSQEIERWDIPGFGEVAEVHVEPGLTPQRHWASPSEVTVKSGWARRPWGSFQSLLLRPWTMRWKKHKIQTNSGNTFYL